jgi:hypothetical protein
VLAHEELFKLMPPEVPAKERVSGVMCRVDEHDLHRHQRLGSLHLSSLRFTQTTTRCLSFYDCAL